LKALGKGKLERWHRTFRAQFLSELDGARIKDLSDLNARLWSWIETVKCCVQHLTVYVFSKLMLRQPRRGELEGIWPPVAAT
jgi:hypothetical protein